MPISKQRVFVNTALEMLPLAGAKVVTKKKDGTTFFEQFTDADGLTEYIVLDCPNKELTLNPETAKDGFSLYDVIVSKSGYHTVHIYDVEIVESADSYLPVQMHPDLGVNIESQFSDIYIKGDYQSTGKTPRDSYSIPYIDNRNCDSPLGCPAPSNFGVPAVVPVSAFGGGQAAVSNRTPASVPRPDSKSAGACCGSVTVADDLDDIHIPVPAVLQPLQSGTTSGPALSARPVLIPTYITIRLGTPSNNAARNVRVPFVEYVANVASSEIFATWPIASLEANIHAITTFALNRVFTEWYPSRGFNFNITNSTQFDQFFVYGRNIFQNLLEISARIFNQYVHRIGLANPMFTTYRANACGANCLSQWGTVTLANQGQNALQILRHFYGSDVTITTSNNVQDIRSPYPGTPMRLGDESRYVQLMQQHLNRIRQNFPAIPLIANENGVFGTDTQAAVREFQRINGLNPDGVIGPATWNRITQVWVGVTRLADINSEGVRIGIGLTPPNVVLRSGSNNNNVRQLQWLLNYIGQYYPVIPGDLTVDGRFGPRTENSVREFQRNFGLTPDGVVGPATWNKLYEVFRRIQVTSPDPAPIPVPPQPPTPTPPPVNPIGPDRFWGTVRTMGGNLNQRSAPSTTAPIVGVIPNGSKLQVTGENNGFYFVSFNGRTGWVSSDFVEITPRNGRVVTQGGNLNLRAAPNTNSQIVAAMPNGCTVTATDVVGNFYQVTWNGQTGFASRDFISIP